MKNTIILIVSILCSIPAFATGPSRVYLFDGFFVSLPVQAFYEAQDKIKGHLDANHPGVIFTARHNSFWRSVCSEIKELPADQKPYRLVLIGHSYGGNAAMDIARCLGNQPVDLVISIDNFQKFFAGDAELVSDNVGANHNFYETISVLQGTRNNHRGDGSYRGITNTEIQVPFSASAHYKIVNELVDRGIVQGLLDQYLQ